MSVGFGLNNSFIPQNMLEIEQSQNPYGSGINFAGVNGGMQLPGMNSNSEILSWLQSQNGGGNGGGMGLGQGLAGGALSAGGLIGMMFNSPKANKIEYKRSAESGQAFSDLMAMPGFQEILSNLNRGTAATVGQTRRQGMQDIQGSLADPGKIAGFLSDLNANTAATATQAQGQNYGTAYNSTLGKSTALGNLSFQEQQIKNQLDMYNAEQEQNKDAYWGNLFGGVAGVGAQLLTGGVL